MAQGRHGRFDELKTPAAQSQLIAAGIIPRDRNDGPAATVAVEHFVHAGYPTDVAGILLCESDGTQEEVADEVRRVEALMEQSGATLIRISQSDAERLRFWAGRKAAFPAVGRISPDYYCMAVRYPQRLSEVLCHLAELERKYNMRARNVFMRRRQLHPLILYDANQPDELDATKFGGEILELSIKWRHDHREPGVA